MDNGGPTLCAMITRRVRSRLVVGRTAACALIFLVIVGIAEAAAQTETRPLETITEEKRAAEKKILELSQSLRVEPTESTKRQLGEAATRYRALAAEEMVRRLLAASADQRVRLVDQFSRETSLRRGRLDRETPIDLWREQRKVSSETERERLFGLAEARMRLARLDESAAFAISVALTPTLHVDFGGHGNPIAILHDRKTVSRTVLRLGDLIHRIGSNDPDNVISSREERDLGIDLDLLRALAKVRRDQDLEEFRLLALTGTIVDPETEKPIEGALRLRIARTAERNLAEYARWRSRRTNLQELLLWDDSRVEFASEIDALIARKPEYRILKYLTDGVEPGPQEYFRAAAQVLRRAQSEVMDLYNEGYLGGKWHRVNLEQLLRVRDVDWSDLSMSSGITEVRRRLVRFNTQMNAAADALSWAAVMTPGQLAQASSTHHALLKSYGYIEEDQDGTERYVVDPSRSGFGATVNRQQRLVDIPGAGPLSVINLTNIAEATASVAVPELMSARMLAYANKLSRGPRLAIEHSMTLAEKLLLETAIGAGVDAIIEAGETGTVDLDRLILESFVLGSVLQISGGLSDRAFNAGLFHLGKTLRKTELHAFFKKNKALAKQTEAWAREALTLSSETVVTTFFQKYVEGHMDETSWQIILVNSGLTHSIAKRVDFMRALPTMTRREFVSNFLPDFLHSHFLHRPRLADEVLANVKQHLEHAKERLEHNLRMLGAEPGERVKAVKLFMALHRGDMQWVDAVALHQDGGPAMDGVQTKVAQMRNTFVDSFVWAAVKQARKDVNQHFDLLVQQAIREAGSREQARDAIKKIEALRSWEINLLNRDPPTIRPGSGGATSDVDRSSPSWWLLRRLGTMYETLARLENQGDIPTSARAFDHNEYLEVFPFIKENRKISPTLRESIVEWGSPHVQWIGIRHGDVMSALGLAGAMNYMSTKDRIRFVENKRRTIRAKVSTGELTRADLNTFNRKVELAIESLAKSEERITKQKKAVAERTGKEPDHPDVETLARMEVYLERVKKFTDDSFLLSQFEDPNGPRALQLRTKMERDLSIMMRDGIETYSHPIGVDIVVNMVQLANKSEVKLIDDPDFKVRRTIDKYDASDAESGLNDQIMFLMEHVHAFNSGHESPYQTGRAIGKYVVRSFLFLKSLGLDIAEVRQRPKYDPRRRLLEAGLALLEVKNDPQKLLAELTRRSGRLPKTPENGIAELFALMEQVIPGMEGLTGVQGLRDGQTPQSQRQANAMYRRARSIIQRRWAEEKKVIQEIAGSETVASMVDSMIGASELEIKSSGEEIRRLEQLGGEYLVTDWPQVERLERRLAWLRLERLSAPWPHRSRSDAFKGILQEESSSESKLRQLRERFQRVTDQIRHTLYERDPRYGRLIDRREFLQASLPDLRREREEALEKARREAVLESLDLSGEWRCGLQPRVPGTAKVAHRNRAIEISIKWEDLPGDGPHFKIKGEYMRGQIRGRWMSLVGPALPSPLNDGSTLAPGGLIEAFTKEDGSEIQFGENSFTHPDIKVDGVEIRWSGMICRRRGLEDGPVTEAGFKTVSITPATHPTIRDRLAREGRGLLVVEAQGPNGENVPGFKFRVYRGRRPIRPVQGSEYPAGPYTVVFEVGGVPYREPLEVEPGKETLLKIRTGAMVLSSRTVDDQEVPSAHRAFIYLADQPDDAVASDLYSGKVFLGPGRYIVEFRGISGSIWRRNLAVSADRTVNVSATWSRLRLQVGSGGADRFAYRRSAAQGMHGDWFGLAAGQRFVDLPPGEYDLRWQRGARRFSHRVKIDEGEDKTVDVRAIQDFEAAPTR